MARPCNHEDLANRTSGWSNYCFRWYNRVLLPAQIAVLPRVAHGVVCGVHRKWTVWSKQIDLMINDARERKPFSPLQLVKGLAVGVLIAALCLAMDVFLGLVLADTHVMFLNALATVMVLVVIGLLAARRSQDTGFVRGVLIALSLAAIIATACGVAMGPGPLRFN